jgi:hypothetical protein
VVESAKVFLAAELGCALWSACMRSGDAV